MRLMAPKMLNRRIRIDIAYDGSFFVGWQIQKEGESVQSVLELALEQLLGEKSMVTGAGRTDSGVHAKCTVAHFDVLNSTIPSEKFSIALNSILPKSIRILRSTEVSSDFHARYSAVERGYKYYLSQANPTLPFDINYCWDIRRNLNINLLNRYASKLVGEHDFTTFSSAGDKSPSKVRIITAASFYPEGDKIVFQISGNGFLWKMVRSIVGTLIESEKARLPLNDFINILKRKDRKLAGSTAPAKGLFLDFVRYPGDPGGTGFEYPLQEGELNDEREC